MIRRTIATRTAILLSTLLLPSVSSASALGDLRHEQGVELMEVQREGLRTIMEKLRVMKGLAEIAMQPGTTQQERIQLDTRFQKLDDGITTLAHAAGAHGYHCLYAATWIAVEVSPGSTEFVDVHGFDARSANLSINDLGLYYQHEASAAFYGALPQAMEYVRNMLQRNCSNYARLGVDAHCGRIESFCRVEPNSTGSRGHLSGYGPLTLGVGEPLFLQVENCPNDNLGWYVMGQGMSGTPLVKGDLCVDPGHPSFMRLSPGELTGVGAGSQLALTTDTPWLKSILRPGSTWAVQFIYIDSAASHVNSTNALRIRFEP